MAKKRTTPATFGDQLRRIIDTCGVSRYRISQETGIDQTQLSRFMVGERGLSMKALDRLGKYLGLKVTMHRTPKDE